MTTGKVHISMFENKLTPINEAEWDVVHNDNDLSNLSVAIGVLDQLLGCGYSGFNGLEAIERLALLGEMNTGVDFGKAVSLIDIRRELVSRYNILFKELTCYSD